jgi:hypothetical protein
MTSGSEASRGSTVALDPPLPPAPPLPEVSPLPRVPPLPEVPPEAPPFPTPAVPPLPEVPPLCVCPPDPVLPPLALLSPLCPADPLLSPVAVPPRAPSAWYALDGGGRHDAAPRTATASTLQMGAVL